ncbi:MAG TPA: UDP-N-acetylglucosamine--N-acetylmuramyl-(pentapeptide) pyrophosphoryl-undecaprenol N-acetylglucosamine transferase, partial [Gemmatimonadales bacterium]|nr:UDP-N-acetylglucosamine--N-acetylmuramyl-(pentapeptide) pyrophosphoryl-undecaprenol N-acetylglucosamine transferase [Gemmatimonadales bacterium]
GVESHVLPARHWDHALLPLEPVYRGQWWKNVRLPWSVYRSVSAILTILRRENPVLVVGTGGYVSGPVVWVAARRGVPAIIQEQNAYPGITTRLLAGRVRQIHLGFPEGRRFIRPGPATEVLDSGNPIEPPPAPDRRMSRAESKRRLGLNPDRPLVVVVGGSQGALAINQVMAAAVESGHWPQSVSLVWQTGTAHADRFLHLARAGVRIQPFLDPISDVYSAADLLLTRAGAMTLAEEAAWGLPAILVPLPTAAANHQLHNARAVAAAGAAVLIEQRDLTAELVIRTVSELLEAPERLAVMSRRALERGRPQAAETIATAALRLMSIA